MNADTWYNFVPIIIFRGDGEIGLSHEGYRTYLELLNKKYKMETNAKKRELMQNYYNGLNLHRLHFEEETIGSVVLDELAKDNSAREYINSHIENNRNDAIIIQVVELLKEKASGQHNCTLAIHKLVKGTKFYIKQGKFGEEVVKMNDIEWMIA